MIKEEIDEQIETIYKLSELLFTECYKVLNYRPGSKRHEELNHLTRGLQQFTVDYKKWKRKRGIK